LPGTDEWQPSDRRDGAGHRRARSGGAVIAEQVAGRVRALGRDARQPEKRGRIIVLAGLAVVVLLAAIGAWSGWFSSGGDTASPPAANSPAPASQGPLIPVQQYKENGIAVNVPQGWTRSPGGSYVDFIDPAATGNSGRKVRINVEASTATPDTFLNSAENQLKKPAVCPTPYNRAALKDAPLAGKPGGQLEYTCGAAPTMRHGISQVVIVDKTAYYFYLTVPDSQFAVSKVIFDEMIRSFTFVSA
jgi:hypothetical protein